MVRLALPGPGLHQGSRRRRALFGFYEDRRVSALGGLRGLGLRGLGFQGLGLRVSGFRVDLGGVGGGGGLVRSLT